MKKKKLDNQFKKKGLLFKFLRLCVKVFFRGANEYIGLENLPSEPCVCIGNHAHAYGPLNGELKFPTKKLIWCDAPMFSRKEFVNYAYNNFFSKKPNVFLRAGIRILSPLVAYIFKNADAMPVYRDMRIMKTYKISSETLLQGANVVIFPECPEQYNEITNQFNEYFVDVARFHYKHYQKELSFVPFYYAPGLKKMIFGKPVKFDATRPIEEERKRICAYLMNEITAIAKQLPVHKVIPFHQVKKKDYKNSK